VLRAVSVAGDGAEAIDLESFRRRRDKSAS
jgi:hypothetical protein